MKSFFFLQRCNSNNCDIFQDFTISLNSYNEQGMCVLNEVEQKLLSFKCDKCQMITFDDLKKNVNEHYIVFLKERRQK